MGSLSTIPLAFPFLLNQTATYWAPGGSDGFGGVTFAAPILITCRWEDSKVLFRTASNEEHTSSAQIWPDRVLLEKGYLAQGDFTGTPSPKTLGTAAREIRSVNESPSVDGDEKMVKVYV